MRLQWQVNYSIPCSLLSCHFINSVFYSNCVRAAHSQINDIRRSFDMARVDRAWECEAEKKQNAKLSKHSNSKCDFPKILSFSRFILVFISFPIPVEI